MLIKHKNVITIYVELNEAVFAVIWKVKKKSYEKWNESLGALSLGLLNDLMHFRLHEASEKLKLWNVRKELSAGAQWTRN